MCPRKRKKFATSIAVGVSLALSGSGCGIRGNEILLRMEEIKAQERLETQKLEVLRELRTLVMSLPNEEGPIAEIETDELGKTHVKIFPQNQREKQIDLIEKFLTLQHEGIQVGSIQIEEREDLREEVINKGYELARFGIGGLLMREIVGLIVHGPNWEWKGIE